MLSLVLFSNLSPGQSLSLNDIFKIHSPDSVSLRDFCIEKEFVLEMIDEDDWVFKYSITSNANKNLYIQRTFPKDKKDRAFVRYYFDAAQDYKKFEDSIKVREFVRVKHKSTGKKIDVGISTIYYFNEVLKMEIGMEKHSSGRWKYAITLSQSPWE